MNNEIPLWVSLVFLAALVGLIVGVSAVSSRMRDQRVEAQCLAAGYGAAVCERIVAGQVWVGMPAELARLSWGRPTTINRTTYNGTREQWVYRIRHLSRYLYFRDGVLTTIQN